MSDSANNSTPDQNQANAGAQQPPPVLKLKLNLNIDKKPASQPTPEPAPAVPQLPPQVTPEPAKPLTLSIKKEPDTASAEKPKLEAVSIDSLLKKKTDFKTSEPAPVQNQEIKKPTLKITPVQAEKPAAPPPPPLMQQKIQTEQAQAVKQDKAPELRKPNMEVKAASIPEDFKILSEQKPFSKATPRQEVKPAVAQNNIPTGEAAETPDTFKIIELQETPVNKASWMKLSVAAVSVIVLCAMLYLLVNFITTIVSI